MKHEFTDVDRKIVKFFLANGNERAYQKQIAENTKVSENWLGKRLPILFKAGILKSQDGLAGKRGRLTHFYHLALEAGEQVRDCLEPEDKQLFYNSDYRRHLPIKEVAAIPPIIAEIVKELLYNRGLLYSIPEVEILFDEIVGIFIDSNVEWDKIVNILG